MPKKEIMVLNCDGMNMGGVRGTWSQNWLPANQTNHRGYRIYSKNGILQPLYIQAIKLMGEWWWEGAWEEHDYDYIQEIMSVGSQGIQLS